MFNPMAMLNQKILEGLIKKGDRYLVRQHYPRGKYAFDENIKGYFLFSFYKDHAKAKEHYEALAGDPYRYLYDAENPSDLEKLKVAASAPSGYKIYINLFVPNWERHITPRLKKQFKAYVTSLGWRPKGSDNINPAFYLHFGELCVSLRFGKREVKVKLEEIEKL